MARILTQNVASLQPTMTAEGARPKRRLVGQRSPDSRPGQR